MNSRMKADLYGAGVTSPAMLRALLDYTATTVAPRRKRKQRPSATTSIALLLAASALLVFAMGAIR